MIRVLHADDDTQVAGIVRLLFEERGKEFVVEHVDSGRACIAAMQRGGYDLLLLDLVMPDLDGLHVLGELTARGDPTPVVMVSAQGQHELTVRALRAGAFDCVDKNSADFRALPEFARGVLKRFQKRLPTPPPARDRHILVIEPDPTTQQTITDFLANSSSRIFPRSIGSVGVLGTVTDAHPIDAIVVGPTLTDTTTLDTLRRLRSILDDVPVLILSLTTSSDTAVAAFQLGAHDLIHFREGCLADLVFSLNSALKRRDTERLNAQLGTELAALNESLAAQVKERTRDLEAQIAVRQAAERRAEEHAARLQALSTRLLRVQEDERHAIARELHDQVGQLLTGLRFRIEAAHADPAALNEALIVTDELLRTVRELTLQLRPRMLDDLGLQPALEWHVSEFQKQTGIAVELDIAMPRERITSLLATTLYRIVQEALTNVARHSGASSACVTVAADERSLHVEISDRGCGFDSAAAFAKHNSVGLAGLAERVNLAGGTLEIFSKAGEGTRLHAEFALGTDTGGSPLADTERTDTQGNSATDASRSEETPDRQTSAYRAARRSLSS